MQSKIYGHELVLDLKGCCLKTITSKKAITYFISELCKLIKMNKYGQTHLKYFGNKYSKGYSVFQFIETSSITGHFSDEWQSAYLNIFSCKPFNPKVVEAYCKYYFNAKKSTVRFLSR